MSDVKYILDSFLFIFSGVLVMWMTVGFAMLEAGLTRVKNNATVLTKNVLLFATACFMYYLFGYGFMYGDGNMFIGSGFMLSNVSNESVSGMSDFFFQTMFAATTASIISGTVAERMKVPAFIVFVVVIAGFIYPVVGHWTWGGSLTGKGGILEGFTDFAGSTIVHGVGGWAALAGVLLLGARTGKYSKSGKIRPLPGSSMPLATIGTMILWMGWFGFNGGSVLAMGSRDDVSSIATVMVNTNLAAVSGMIAAAILTQLVYKKLDLTMVLNGALAGLVAVTAAPDQSAEYAVMVGGVGGLLVVLSIAFFDRIKIDDPVGALSVHLVVGIWGTLAVAFTQASTFMTQLTGVVVIGAFTFIVSFAIWYIIDLVIGLRVSEEEEILGMDISEIGLEAYPEFK